jgi:hypothetical protein
MLYHSWDMLVYRLLIVSVCLFYVVCVLVVFSCVVCWEGYFHIGLFKQVSEEGGFFTSVSESGPLWCWVLCVCGLGCFLWLPEGVWVGRGIGKALLYRMFWMVVLCNGLLVGRGCLLCRRGISLWRTCPGLGGRSCKG